MENGTKKVLIWGGVGLAVVIIYLVTAKLSSPTTVLPVRTQTPGSPLSATSLLNSITGFAKSLVVKPTLPPGFKMAANGQITTAQGTAVKTYDPNTGAYQEADGTWYTTQGTPLTYYNITNGVYQEEADGTYYTFDGTALAYYDPTTGNYVEETDPTTEYNNAGVVINNNYTAGA